MAVFESKEKFRLVGGTISKMDLIKSNINSIEVKKREEK